MRKILRIYKPFTHAGFLLAAQYRVNFIFFIFGDILRCFINYFLWHAVFTSGGAKTFMGFSEHDMVVYIFISFLTGIVSYSDGAFAVGEEIRDGSIAMRMIKPIRFEFAFLFQELGERTMTAMIVFVPLMAGVEIYKFAATGVLGFNIWYFLVYLLSLTLSYLINFYFNVCYGYSAFVLKYLWGSNLLKDCIVGFLSGGVVPLAFMPAGLGFVLNLLPFASLTYIPVMIYLGMYDVPTILLSLGLQVFWLAFFIFLQRIIWNACVRHMSVQGG
ncbi:MAG: ABC-2 family transporter protein [Ruminococcus sp.]|nr:ABC-2 family transporter protein [Ruminococcus sp.]